MQAPSLFIAFIAGLLSFLSPCVLPLVPAYIGYMSGSAARQARAVTPTGRGAAVATMSTGSVRWVMLAHAAMFVLGLTIVLAMFGYLVSFLRDFYFEYKSVILFFMGALLVIFGVFMLGVINIPFLNYTRRVELRPASSLGYLRSFLIGLGFGVGWSPCIGPTLALVFNLALGGRQGEAVLPFIAYALGMGVPFMVVAVAMGQISAFLKKITRRSFSLKIGNWTVMDQVNIISVAGGALLIIMGILIMTNKLTVLAPNTNWFDV